MICNSDFCQKKQLENQLELLKLFLPEILVEHFDLINSKTEEETLHLFFEEQNKPPVEHASKVLISKGFPLRGKKVFLNMKRRHWTEKQTNLIVQRDWNLVSKGSRMT